MRRTTWITGASSGLGAGTARELAARGGSLALAARRTDRLEALAAELRDAHPGIEVRTYTLDVDDHDAVAETFRRATVDLGGIDRVVVNAGLGKGARIGTGRFDVNRATLTTNLVSALAQVEVAMEHFYERGSGHLVLVSSMSAMRGMPGTMTAYAASKAGLAMIGEGLRSDLLRGPGRRGDLAVTTLFPGYVESEMNDRTEQSSRLLVDTATGCRAMVDAIDKEVAEAEVPAWPWKPIGFVLRHAPLPVVRRLV